MIVTESYVGKNGKTLPLYIRVCEACGDRRRVTPMYAWGVRNGFSRAALCRPCAYTPTYASVQERDREDKRRYRARLHARGLSSTGKPLVGLTLKGHLAASHRIALPTPSLLEAVADRFPTLVKPLTARHAVPRHHRRVDRCREPRVVP